MSFNCPFPLSNADGDATNAIPVAENLFCAFQCTGTMSNDEDIDNYESLILIVGGISLFLALLCLCTWGMFSVKSKQKMTFWVTFCSVAVTSFIFFPVLFQGVRDVWCKDGIEPRSQSDGLSTCVLQGMAIQFFGLALCAWWWCSCFDLFSKLFLRQRNIGHYLKYYHCFSWGLPLICTIAVLATGEFGFAQPRLWCFLADGAPDAYEYIFFYAWIVILWLTGTIMFFLTLYSLFSGSGNQRDKNKRKNYLKKLSIYRVPLIFVLIFSVFWAIFFTFAVVADVQEEEFIDSATSWFTCLIGAATSVNFSFPDPANEAGGFVDFLDPQPDGDQAGCGTVQPGRLSPVLLTIAVLALAGNGSLMFLIFGLQMQNFTLWSRYISSGFKADSVRPKKKKGAKGLDKEYSTFQELRMGIAKANIYLCEKFAGVDGETNNNQEYVPKRPILNNDNSSYEPKFVDNRTEYASKELDQADAANFPRVSYQQPREEEIDEQALNPSFNEAQDPFPAGQNKSKRPKAEGGPPGLERFYDGSKRQESSTRQHVSTAEWSDIYEDDLWGGYVEF